MKPRTGSLIASLSWIVFLASGGSAQAKSSDPRLFVSAAGYQAVVSFDGVVEFEGREDSFLLDEGLFQQKVREQIYQAISPIKMAEKTAGISQDYRVTVSRYEQTHFMNRVRAEYHFEGRMMLHKDVGDEYPMLLVLNPDEAQRRGRVACMGEHDFPFWYYWNPFDPKCPLKEGVDWNWVKAKVKKIDASEDFAPRYEQLVNQKGDIVIHALFGPNEKHGAARDPNDNSDIGAKSFRKFRAYFKERGYERRIFSYEEAKKLTPLFADVPHVEEMYKQTPRGRVVIRLFYGQPFVIGSSRAFRDFFSEAMEKASVVLYSGHAGQGFNLDLDMMRLLGLKRLSSDPDKYQIVHLATCLSYTYYADMFLGWKGRDKSGDTRMDFLSYAGDETPFSLMGHHLANLVLAIEEWGLSGKVTTYGELAKLNNADTDRTLFSAMRLLPATK